LPAIFRAASQEAHLPFQVLTAASMKMTTVFRYVAPCSLVETDRRFRGAYYLHINAIAYFSKTYCHTEFQNPPLNDTSVTVMLVLLLLLVAIKYKGGMTSSGTMIKVSRKLVHWFKSDWRADTRTLY
jgi:hypothetical protein